MYLSSGEHILKPSSNKYLMTEALLQPETKEKIPRKLDFSPTLCPLINNKY